MSNPVYRLLEVPWVYRLSQAILGPGGEAAFTRLLEGWVAELPRVDDLLDVGCGPASLLWRVGLRPVGLDLSAAYARKFTAAGGAAVAASAAALPFADGSFGGVWSIGLLHHLPDEVARQSVAEMRRVARPGGYVAIFDGVIPEPGWRRPYIWAQRKFDRGRYMRRQARLESLLADRAGWACRRVQYSPIGHEGLVCTYLKAGDSTPP